jgi:hypothetical protein
MALARSSSEVLFYGRIFSKDIQSVERWTSNVSSCYIETEGTCANDQDFGDQLPEEYFIPKKYRRSNRWIDNLVWDAEDSYSTASDKIAARKRQIRSSRGQ